MKGASMKSLALLACFSLVYSLTASAETAAAPRPLIVKSNSSGYVMPEYRRDERCEVYEHSVVIKKVFGMRGDEALTVTREIPISISTNNRTVLLQAATEKVEEKPNGLCDGPATSITAFDAHSSSKEGFVLFQTGGCGSPRQMRTGPSSDALRDIVNTYCPETFDFANGTSAQVRSQN